MLKEFKEFATRGNMMDMAIGVIIGGAFQKIVTSLVNDIIMPAVSIFTGKVDFSDLTFTVGSASIKYGSFITAVIDFLIIAFSIFIALKSANSINKKMEKLAKNELNKINNKTKNILKTKNSKSNNKDDKEETPSIKICPYCFSEINYNATKCPHCTSDLPVPKDTEA
ncbi:MAG: large conductance mechanosensitive channel protein MscL [Clostridia bacterium]